MNTADQVKYAQINDQVQERLKEQRKAISEKIKESNLGIKRKNLNDRIKECLEEAGLTQERREIAAEVRDSDYGKKRADVNDKLRDLRADENTVKWAKGKASDMQLTFKFETEDPDQLMADVRQKPVKKKDKKKEEKAA